MNIEKTYQALKYSYPTPLTVTEWIDHYLEFDCLDQPSHTEWILENNIYRKYTHFFSIYVHYDDIQDSTLCSMKFKDDPWFKHLHISYQMHCLGKDIDEFTEHFGEIYEEFTDLGRGVEYKMNYPYTIIDE